MVSRLSGKKRPMLRMAARTLSRLSCTAASGRPTVVIEGSPRPLSTSTSMSAASNPKAAHKVTLASVDYPGCEDYWKTSGTN
jgi:hypothetical protein